MASSNVEICNMALSHLRGNQLTSLENDDSNEADLCRANFASARDATLEDRDWSFASHRRTLTPLASTDQRYPEFLDGNAFLLPGECIIVRQAGAQYDFKDNLFWELQERIIIANCDILYTRYTKRVTDVSLYSPGFDQAFAARLAMDIAIGVTGSVKTQSLMADLYAGKLNLGSTNDSLQGKSQRLRVSRLVGCR